MGDDYNFEDILREMGMQKPKHRTDFVSTKIPTLDAAIAQCMDLADAITRLVKKP